MLWSIIVLTYGDDVSKHSTILIQYQHVTDRQTHYDSIDCTSTVSLSKHSLTIFLHLNFMCQMAC